MTRTFSDGHPKVLPACNFLSQYYFYNIFLQKSCRFSLQTLTKFEAAKTGSSVEFLRLTAVWGERSSVKCLGLTAGDPFSPHLLPLYTHPLPTSPQFFLTPGVLLRSSAFARLFDLRLEKERKRLLRRLVYV